LDRSVIIVSPYFSPSTATGVHRARHLAKHLPAVGWTPIVLCVDEAFHEPELDRSLLDLTPSSIEVIKVPAIPYWMTRPFGLGDISLRAWFQLRARLVELLQSRSISTVLITSAPYYTLMMSPMIKRDFSLPIVLDFQDPWVSAWGAKQTKWSKAGFSHRLASLFEPHAVRSADFITSVSETQNAEMASRYPWFSPSRMVAIPIGGDQEDFDRARTVPASRQSLVGEDGFIELSYVGSYWPAAESPFRTFLKGVARLRAIDPAVTKKLRLNFIGTDAGAERYTVRAIAEAEGVSACIRELPNRLPYLDALAVMAHSDGLLLIGSDEPHYTASKIYPALMSGRPYLSLIHNSSNAHAILSAAGGGIVLGFSNANELASLEVSIAEALRTLALAPQSLGKADPGAYAPYEASAIARKYADIFNRVSNEIQMTA
jgi:hypothetical protein